MSEIQSQRIFDTIIIGGGQAGLTLGYYLARQGRNFVILDANDRPGASWRRRWDSLRLFTPAWISSLPGMPHQGSDTTFLSKDEIANYLERYAAHFHLPVLFNCSVESLVRQEDTYLLSAGREQFSAHHVVIATGAYQRPRLPLYAVRLDPQIVQMHSDDYRNPGQLREGNVLVVGAGSSGSEIALELASRHRVWLAGRDPGHRPKNIPLLLRKPYWWLIHQAINTDKKMGRRMQEQTEMRGAPLIGIPKNAFKQANVARIPRVVGIQEGKPLLGDGQVLDVANVIWSTGYMPDYQWIHLPIFSAAGRPIHTRGIIESQPGLYFLGLPFQYTLSSSFIGGVGRDAEYIAEHIAQNSSSSEAQHRATTSFA